VSQCTWQNSKTLLDNGLTILKLRTKLNLKCNWQRCLVPILCFSNSLSVSPCLTPCSSLSLSVYLTVSLPLFLSLLVSLPLYLPCLMLQPVKKTFIDSVYCSDMINVERQSKWAEDPTLGQLETTSFFCLAPLTYLNCPTFIVIVLHL